MGKNPGRLWEEKNEMERAKYIMTSCREKNEKTLKREEQQERDMSRKGALGEKERNKANRIHRDLVQNRTGGL